MKTMKNNISSVIQRNEVTKNLGNTHLMSPRSFATLWMTILMLLLAACTQDDSIIAPEGTLSVPGMKTVTVDLGMPEGRPAFGEGTTRATTTGTWAEGDELMMTISVADTETTGYTSYLTLACDDNGKWDVVADKSRTKRIVGTDITDLDFMLLEQTEDIDLSGQLNIRVPEDMTLADGYPRLFFIYAPELEYDITNAGSSVGFKLKEGATTTAPEYWYFSAGENAAWTTFQTRLRVYIGAKGDVVTLTSSMFVTHGNYNPTGTYTATTDASGNAYFYGSMPKQTSGFNVELTAVSVGGVTVPVSPVTLLQASDLVPVTLEAGKGYKLDGTDKRAGAASGIAVIDGTLNEKTEGDDNDVASVQAAIAGKTTIIVTGETLAAYSGDNAKTVVGEAIRTSGAADGSISLVLADATSIRNYAFYTCSALTSVTLPKATSIGTNAFLQCFFLTSVTLPVATEIGLGAFSNCFALKSVSLPAATTIGEYAFRNCSSLTSLTFGSVITSVGSNAFDGTPADTTTDWTTLCDLTLVEGSTGDPNTETKTWAGKAWKSITITSNSTNNE